MLGFYPERSVIRTFWCYNVIDVKVLESEWTGCLMIQTVPDARTGDEGGENGLLPL